MARLGDICDILDNKRVPITSSNRKVGPYPYYGANGVQSYIADYIFDDELVLLAEDGGYFGSKDRPIAYRVSGKCWVNNHAHVLKPKDSVNVDYLCYSLMFRDISDIVNGATRQKLTQADMRKIEIALPAIVEQKQIVVKLDKVKELIYFRKQQLKKLDQLVKSQFIEMFGDPEGNPLKWTKCSLNNIITRANNGMSRRGNDISGNIVLRLVELQNGYIDYTNPNRINLADAEKQRYLLERGDFLFARVNGNPDYVGRCAVFNALGEPVYHNDHIIRVHFDEAKLNGIFASALFNSLYGRKQMQDKIKTSAGQYTINQEGIGAIVTILPPLDLQNQFAAFVQQVDKSKLTIQQSLDKLNILYKSLMQQYFG